MNYFGNLFSTFHKMTNRNSPQSPPIRKHLPKYPRLGIEIPLGLPEHLPEPEVTPLSVAPGENDDNFLELFNRVDI